MHPLNKALRRGPPAAAAGRACLRNLPVLQVAGLALLLAVGMAALPARGADAVPGAEPRELLASLAEGEEMVASGAPARGGATSRQQVTVRRGESLDALVRRGLPDLPFKDAFLRQAVMDMNPAVFRSGATQRLTAGTVLQLPSLDDLCHMLGAAPLAARSPSASSAARAPTSVPAQAPAPARPADQAAASVLDERKRWVRYP